MQMKFYSLLILVFLVLSCSGEEKKVDTKSKEKTEESQEVVRVYIASKGTESLPFYTWPEASEKPTGIEPRLIEYILDQVGLKYEFVTDYEFDGEGDPRLEALTSGKADISMRGITINDQRAEEVLFSEVYHTDGAGIMVMQSSELFELKDLVGKKVYALRFSTSFAWVEKTLKGADLISAEVFGKENEPIDLLREGKIDAYVADYGKLKKVQKEMATDTRLFMKKFSSEDYGIAISKDRPDLKEKIDKVIVEMRESGRLADFTSGFGS